MKLLGHDSSIEINLNTDISLYETSNWRKEWINFNIIIKLPCFYSNFNVMLMGDDIIDFVHSLTEAHKSSFSKEKKDIKFETLEESVYLHGVVDYKGTIEWDGFVIYPVGDGNKLNFKFESELNQIINIKNQLQQECHFLFS